MEDRVFKTTSKLIFVLTLAVCWSPACGWAGVQSALPLLLGAASLGDDGHSTVAQADALLREARAAMSLGKYEVADAKISSAEALQPKYPLFHIGDTPKRARADLDKLLAEKAGANRNGPTPGGKTPAASQDPFLAHQSPANSNADGMKAAAANSAGANGKNTSGLNAITSGANANSNGSNAISSDGKSMGATRPSDVASRMQPLPLAVSQNHSTPAGRSLADLQQATPPIVLPPVGQTQSASGLRMPADTAEFAAAPADTSSKSAPMAGGMVPPNALAAMPDANEANPWESDGPAKSSGADMAPAKAGSANLGSAKTDSDQMLPANAASAGFVPPPMQARPRSEDAVTHSQNAARNQSDELLLAARRLLAHDDLLNAQVKIDQAQGLGISYSALDDSPAKIESLIVKLKKLPANVTASDAESTRRLRAEVLMEQAEGLLRWHDFDEAQRLAGQAQQLGINYTTFEAQPEQLLNRISTARRAAGLPDTAGPTTFAAAPAALPNDLAAVPIESADVLNKQRATEMAKQARAAMAQGDLATAEAVARQAELLAPDTAFAANEDRPTLVLLDIERAKRNGGPAAGISPVDGNARIADGGVTPASAYEPVQAGGPVAANDSRYPNAQALYNPDQDSTYNMPASNSRSGSDHSLSASPVVAAAARSASTSSPSPMGNTEPTPENGTGEGLRWYRAGAEAMAKSRTDDALQDFRRAYAFQAELDPETRQELYDHLKILGQPVDPMISAEGNTRDVLVTGVRASGGAPQAVGLPAPASPTVGTMLAAAAASPSISMPPMPLDGTTVTSATLSRQVAAEVTRQQSLARDMREKQPKQALELLQRTRDMVASVAGLDAAAREQMLRRLDLSIQDLQQYIAANSPEIDQEEKNRQVQQDVDRTRKEKVETQEKVAALVKDFNKLLDEQRYPEAQVVAKRATELDPENPVVVQLQVMAKMVSRVASNQQVQDQQEEGFWATMQEVDKSAIPFPGDYQMPDARKWDALSKSKFRQQREGEMHHTAKEQEIEQRLSTPVALKFDKRPLSEVIEYLGKIAQVPTYLDPQGLQAEGVQSDTPISIDLSQDVSLKSALKLILEPLQLTYVIKDEVLKITSIDVKRGQLYPVTYPVGDLVIRIPNFAPTGQEGINGAFREAMARNGWGGAAGGGFGTPAPALAVNEPANNSVISPTLLTQQMGTRGIPIPLSGSGQSQSGSPQNIPFGPGGMKGGAQADFDTLIDLITSTISPQSWSEMGGPGTIQGYDTNLSLVVSQTQEVHEQIADLLTQLRKLEDLQVTIEVRFITLEDDFFERIGVNFQFNIPTSTTVPNPPPSALLTPPVTAPPSFGPVSPSAVVGLDSSGAVTPLQDIQFRQGGFGSAIPTFGGFDAGSAATFGFAILSDIQAFFVVQAAEGDTRSNVLQAPKVTLFNGQQATVSDTTQVPFVTSVIPVVGDFAAAQQPVIVVLSEGTSLTVQAVVSNDRRFVRLTVVPFFSNIGAVNTFTFTGSTSSTQKSSESQNSTDQSSSTSNENDSSNVATTVQLPQFSFVTVTTTVSVPDGGTVLLGGIKRLSEGRIEEGVPVLSKLPYINRLFRNTGIGRTTTSLMMMVTPRIIIQEEEENNLIGPPSP
ncbi:MAG TPA: hypothetical protein VMJ32_14205 [Pirellulales bacterium]|nr:hypothetical protein [Pirellulales bacterium]